MRVEDIPGLHLWHRVAERLRGLGAVRSGDTAAPPPEVLPSVQEREIEAPAPGLVRVLTGVSRWSGAAAMLIGYHGLVGWTFGIDLLTSPGVGFLPIRAHEAVAALAAGGAILVYGLADPSLHRIRRPLLGVTGALTLLLSAYGVFVYLADLVAPEAMSVVSAIALTVVGAALVVLAALRDHAAAQLFALLPAALSLQAVGGYTYGVGPFEGQMPLYTAVATLLLSAALVCVRPDEGFMARIASDSFGGAMARRLLPAALVIPFLLGWMQLAGEHLGLYSAAAGRAPFLVATGIAFVAVVWGSVHSLYRLDARRRQAERELTETAARLGRANADLEQFAYVTSHDLKEPLRAISGTVQALHDLLGDRKEPEIEEFIHHAVDGANRMQTLIDDLLTYSRLTTCEAPLEPTPCEDVFAEVLANLEVMVQESRAIVTHDPLPVVHADRTQLLQVFQNLVSNAIKYRSERTPEIHVSAEDREGAWLFSVRDNGIGIAPEHADRVFEIFQRLHARREYPGTGIGLAVCKKVVERHGGRIWVESEPEEGATFYFTLPTSPVA